MRVVVAVDRSRCQGNQLCLSVAPQHFAIGEDGYARVVCDEPSEADLSALRMAVEACPNGAISVEVR